MIDTNVYEFSRACGGIIFNVDEQIKISKVVINDKKAENNCCYAAIKGALNDGNDFSEFALKNGAKIVLTDDKKKGNAFPRIEVEDVRAALMKGARYYREKELKRVYAVSGSVGKTTVKDMLYSILKNKYKVMKTPENQNNLLGVPLTLLSNADSDTAVIEAGISVAGEMDKLGHMIQPDVAVITNIENMHAETLGSKENTANEKLRLLEYLKKGGKAVLLYDEPFLRSWESDSAQITYVSERNRQANLSLGKCVTSAEGTRFDVMKGDKELLNDVYVPIVGKHNALCALLAIAAAENDVSEAEIRKGLSEVETSNLRQKILKIGECTVLLDAYNAGPKSCAAALDSFDALCRAEREKKKVIAFGSMLELGEISAEEHYKLGYKTAKYAPDKLIIYGDEAENMVFGAEAGGLTKSQIAYFKTDKKADAVAFFQSECECTSIALLKGSRAMRMEDFV